MEHNYKLPKGIKSWNELFDKICMLLAQERSGAFEISGDYTVILVDGIPSDKLLNAQWCKENAKYFIRFDTLTLLALMEIREFTLDAPECNLILTMLKLSEPNYNLQPATMGIYSEIKDKLYKLFKLQKT